jgi:hypothetical protein
VARDQLVKGADAALDHAARQLHSAFERTLEKCDNYRSRNENLVCYDVDGIVMENTQGCGYTA